MRTTLLLCSLCAACEAFASVHPTQLPRAAAAITAGARPALVKMQQEPVAAETNAEATDGSGGVRQLLGLKGASEATGEEFLNWKIRLQLTKPATWVPLIWGVGCGAAASGNYHALWNLFGDGTIPSGDTTTIGLVAEDAVKGFCAMILAGPFSCGFTQTINDWYDRDLDAINEPYRPIPSGKIKVGLHRRRPPLLAALLCLLLHPLAARARHRADTIALLLAAASSLVAITTTSL